MGPQVLHPVESARSVAVGLHTTNVLRTLPNAFHTSISAKKSVHIPESRGKNIWKCRWKPGFADGRVGDVWSVLLWCAV